MMPAFSRAISVIVVPSRCVWSRSIGQITATAASITLVASVTPPSPTSTTATSTGAWANASYANAVITSKNVIGTPPMAWLSTMSISGWVSATSASKSSSLIGSPSMQMRSVTSFRCGLVKRPVRSPSDRSRASIMMAVLPLPLVPAI